jgi:hypothetical protein
MSARRPGSGRRRRCPGAEIGQDGGGDRAGDPGANIEDFEAGEEQFGFFGHAWLLSFGRAGGAYRSGNAAALLSIP